VLSLKSLQQFSLVFLGLCACLCTILAFQFEAYYLVAIPAILVIGLLSVINFKAVYYLLLFTMPLSIEVYFSNSLGTDLPAEPLMIGLMAITFIYLGLNLAKSDLQIYKHPLFLLLVIHYFWIFISGINSEVPLVSMKYFLAKTWYITVFAVLTGLLIRNERQFRPVFWCIFIPLTFLVIQAIARHSMISFTFEDVNTPVMPFFRNHVNYAAMLTLFFPFLILARSWYEKGSWKRRLLFLAAILYLVAIYFSFTRACMLALVVMAVVYLVVRWNLLRMLLPFAVIAVLLFSGYMVSQNKYLDYSPTFEKTVHHDRFDDHISATIALEDASSMERFYRWIAAGFMFAEKPLLGYGPGNFYPFYKQHTVSGFETYLSDNEERSTVHNYFLLILVEQGIIGLLFFAALTLAIFGYAERLYHKYCDSATKPYCMALLLSLVAIYVNLMFSDLIEANKIGPMFFLAIALMINLSIERKRALNAEKNESQALHEATG